MNYDRSLVIEYLFYADIVDIQKEKKSLYVNMMDVPDLEW